MNFLVINFFLISILLLTTFYIFKTTSLISVVALTCIFSLVCTAIYVNLDAVDVAFTEAAVGSGISTILMVSNEKFLHLNSTIIRELAKYSSDLSKFVPKSIEEKLIKKMKEKNG